MTDQAEKPPAKGAPGPWWVQAAVAMAKRPDLWWIALFEARAFVPRRWWRAFPPLPLPSAAWLGFRMETAYGDRTARPSAGDVVAWLEWCREEHARSRPRRQG